MYRWMIVISMSRYADWIHREYNVVFTEQNKHTCYSMLTWELQSSNDLPQCLIWILFHGLLDQRSASISPLREWKMILFRVNAVFGWMPCHNLQQKTEHTYVSCYQQCSAVLLLWLLPCFLNFCFYSSQRSINDKLRGKKAFAFYLTSLFASAAVLLQPFCIPHRADHA